MELPGGRSIPAGRNVPSNPYVASDNDSSAARAHGKGYHYRKRHMWQWGDPVNSRGKRMANFKPHDPERASIAEPDYERASEEEHDARAAWARMGREATGADAQAGWTVFSSLHDIERRDAIRERDRRKRQVDQSYYDAKRQRNMGLLNQAVAQQVPAQPPFQRSFIPHDLRHMLSPNGY